MEMYIYLVDVEASESFIYRFCDKHFLQFNFG